MGALYYQNRELHAEIRDLTLKALVTTLPEKMPPTTESRKIASV